MSGSWFAELMGRLPRLRARQAAQARVGVFLGADYVALAATSSDGDQLLTCDYRDLGRRGQAETLRELVEAHSLGGSPANIVLDGDDYETQQVDIPGVSDAELSAALPFRLKDTLSMPMGEAAAAGHRQRSDRRRAEQSLVLASVARRSRVEELVQHVETAKLRPSAVVSRETAMHELATQSPGAESGVALVLLGSGPGAMTVSRGDDLYLARAHGVSLEMLQSEEGVTKLASEIQRTVDYHDSQLATQPVSRVLLLPAPVETRQMLDSLAENVRVPIAALDATQLLELPEGATAPDTETQTRCMLALAGAMPGCFGHPASLYHPPERHLRYDAPIAMAGYVVAGVALLGAVSLVQGQRLGGLEAELEALEAERDGLQEEVSALHSKLDERTPSEALAARRDRLERQVQQMRELQGRIEAVKDQALAGFARPMSALASEELEPVWLTSLELGVASGGSLEGYALEAGDVVRFIEQLAETAVFRGASFGELEIRLEGGTGSDGSAPDAGGQGAGRYYFRANLPKVPGLDGEAPERAWRDGPAPAVLDAGEEAQD